MGKSYSSAFQDRQLKSLVKILFTIEHPVYNLFGWFVCQQSHDLAIKVGKNVNTTGRFEIIMNFCKISLYHSLSNREKNIFRS